MAAFEAKQRPVSFYPPCRSWIEIRSDLFLVYYILYYTRYTIKWSLSTSGVDVILTTVRCGAVRALSLSVGVSFGVSAIFVPSSVTVPCAHF